MSNKKEKSDINWAARRAAGGAVEGTGALISVKVLLDHLKKTRPNLYKGPFTKKNILPRLAWQLPIAGGLGGINAVEGYIEKKSEKEKKESALPWAVARGTSTAGASALTGLALQKYLNTNLPKAAPGIMGKLKHSPKLLYALAPMIGIQTGLAFSKGLAEKKIEKGIKSTLYRENNKMDKKAQMGAIGTGAVASRGPMGHGRHFKRAEIIQAVNKLAACGKLKRK